MSGTKRHPLHRRPVPHIAPDVVALFARLELTPQSKRNRDEEHELARRLGLTDEWWTMNTVLDRSRRPCHPRGYAAYTNWFRVRRVREALLRMAGL
jgi:hypothetical protein